MMSFNATMEDLRRLTVTSLLSRASNGHSDRREIAQVGRTSERESENDQALSPGSVRRRDPNEACVLSSISG